MLNDQRLKLQGQEDPFRFLYFNHMNLALKTALNSKGGPQLTMETIKLIRNIHSDFSTTSFKKKKVMESKAGVCEVIIRTRSNGWVVGRRANQSHREFFVLIDDKVGTLPEIQEQVDRLARTYFYNIFIH